ncbi:MAG: amino acid ABC transporter permease, partial [Gammaproteobacteria bacterium]
MTQPVNEYEPGTHPDLPPPATQVGVIGWLRQNLFSNWWNSLLTVIGLYLAWAAFAPLIQWAILDADWLGDSRDACTSGGACWVFVNVRFNQFMYGFYPLEEQWRVNLTGIIFVLSLVWLMVPRIPGKRYGALFLLIVFPVVAYYLLGGGSFGLPVVETTRWGGLMLTLILATAGIVAAFPLGILLALG